MWPISRGRYPCRPPKYLPYSRWVFCNNTARLLLGDANVTWLISRGRYPCRPPKFPPYSRWVFCDNTTRLLLGNAMVTWPLCRGMCRCRPPKYPPYSRWVLVMMQPLPYWEMPGSHQNTLCIQGEFFVIIQSVSYWEMPGSRDHCAEGGAPATHQNTLRIQGEVLWLLSPLTVLLGHPRLCYHRRRNLGCNCNMIINPLFWDTAPTSYIRVEFCDNPTSYQSKSRRLFLEPWGSVGHCCRLVP